MHDGGTHGGPEYSVEQLETLHDFGANGATLYAYSSFFASGQLGVDRFHTVKTYLDSAIPLTGDLDLSGSVDFDDIVHFRLGLTHPDIYQGIRGVPPPLHGDTDGDGDLDFDDIRGFVAILSGGTTGGTVGAVPEPSTMTLLLLGGAIALVARGRRRSFGL